MNQECLDTSTVRYSSLNVQLSNTKSPSLLNLIFTLFYPVFLVISMGVLLIETVTYSGFVLNNLQLNLNPILIATVATFTIYSYYLSRAQRKFIYKAILTSTGLILIIFTVLSILERLHFLNYIYSTIHINLNSFLYLVVFFVTISIQILLIDPDKYRIFFFDVFLTIRKSKQKCLLSIFSVILAIILTHQLIAAGNIIAKGTSKVISNIGKTSEEKITVAFGGQHEQGWIVPYTSFINRHTPEEAIIFIPPQMETWSMVGNEGYLRWFIYPRKILRSSKVDDEIPDSAQFILITYGTFGSNGEVVWPRITIDKSKIIKMTFIDRNTLKESEVTDSSYVPNFNAQEWGIIELK